jgi:hypothetical protein
MANKYVEPKTNIPEVITFQFDSFKKCKNTSKRTGKPFTSYSIGVENRGEDKYYSIFEEDYNLFAQLGDLKGRTMEICKVEGEKNRKYLIIKENGVDITPTIAPQATQSPSTTPNVPQQLNPGVLEALQKISTHLNSIDTELERQKWFLDAIYRKIEPGWEALAQDEVSKEDLPK